MQAALIAEGAGAAAPITFHFDYLTVLSPLFFLLRLNAGCSRIVLHPSELKVHMGWAFSTRIPLSRVRTVARDAAWVGGIGVHGFGGRWLVNGSHRNIVQLEIEGGAPARVMGVSLTLTTLRLGVAEAEEFIAAVRAAAGLAE